MLKNIQQNKKYISGMYITIFMLKLKKNKTNEE